MTPWNLALTNFSPPPIEDGQRICITCGTAYWPVTKSNTCSEDCRKLRKKATDAARKALTRRK